MKSKFLNALLLVTSLLGYLEWSGDSHTFLFQAEAEIIFKIFTNPSSIIHPFILLPLLGQILLLITLFRKATNKTLTYIGIGCLGILLGFMFIIGLISLNLKIIISTIPFIIISVISIRHYRQKK